MTAIIWELEQLRDRLQAVEIGHQDFPLLQAVEAAISCLLAAQQQIATLTAEREALTKAMRIQDRAAKTLVAEADRRVQQATAHEPKARVAIATLESEREMNAALTEEIATLTAEVDMLRRAYETVQDNEFAARSPSTHAQNLAQQVRTLTEERDDIKVERDGLLALLSISHQQVAMLTAEHAGVDGLVEMLREGNRSLAAERDEARTQRDEAIQELHDFKYQEDLCSRTE